VVEVRDHVEADVPGDDGVKFIGQIILQEKRVTTRSSAHPQG
jgi:hypothetical protein